MPVSFDAVLALEQPRPDAQFSYGDKPSQFGRLWLPASAENQAVPVPVLVLIHGGCWLEQYAIDHIHPLAGALAKSGIAVWALEYRRVGEAGAGWPGTFQDVADGLEYLRKLDDRQLDLSRVAVAGHSAGGHLALWLAARTGFSPVHPFYSANPLPLRGVIGMAAITDLVQYAQGNSSCQQAVSQLMDGTPAQRPSSYQLASPAALPAPLPLVLIQGRVDPIVPMSQARAMPAARLRPIPGAGHFDLIHPGTPAFGVLVAELNAMLAP